jgi:cyanophycin synthetase
VLIEFRRPSDWPSRWTGLVQVLADATAARRADAREDALDAETLLLRWTAWIQEWAGLPVLESGRVLECRREQDLVVSTLAVTFASSSWRDAVAVFEKILQCMNTAAQGRASPAALRRTVEDALGLLQKQLAAEAMNGTNTLRFLRAAQELDMPWLKLARNAVQIGWGSRARRLDSSLTDQTGAIAVKFAREKPAAAEVLRKAGLPVPPHFLVHSEAEAKAAAAAIGYPVVVKPADLDGGVGVTAGIRGDETLSAAVEHALRFSKSLLVEKHVDGEDYRVVVFQGQVINAIHRLPGGVTGDGQHTVEQLLGLLNADPRRGVRAEDPFRPLAFDAEAQRYLEQSGHTLESVPAAGEFMRLRSAANVASGGMPLAAMDSIHPDNRFLAVRAAQALGLDLAGVDLIIPDIARSWLETGAGICEVNAQPQLGIVTRPQVYGEVLSLLVRGNGRIPVVMVVGDRATAALMEALNFVAGRLGLHVGFANDDHAGVDGRTTTRNGMDFYESLQATLLDREVDLIIACTATQSLFTTGLPLDRFDWLVLPDRISEFKDENRSWDEALVLALFPYVGKGVMVEPRRFDPWERLAPRCPVPVMTYGDRQAARGFWADAGADGIRISISGQEVSRLSAEPGMPAMEPWALAFATTLIRALGFV